MMLRRLGALVVLGMGLALLASVSGAAEKKHGYADSRSPFVHRIPLLDDDGNAISLPAPAAAAGSAKVAPAKPYSPAMTCGKCHDYNEIDSGWHFNANRADVKPGRPGEPWIFLDPVTRTELPLSYRGWTGTYKPIDIGLSDWQFANMFAHHLPGGGVAEAPTTRPSDLKGVWTLAGKMQNDCMICHDAGTDYSPADRELQIKQKNFKFLPTRALGLARIGGSVQDIIDSAEEGEDLAKSKQSPRVIYDPNKFDLEQRVHFNVTRNAPAKCYYCHTANVVGPEKQELWHADKDYHLTAGMTCVDCHRHGIDHEVVRGYEGEAAERKDPNAAALSCSGCHMGVKGAEGTVALGGRLGAPRPQHVGLPPIHLEKLSCTACHSGPYPTDKPVFIQTAMNHELGLESFTRTPESQPRIVATLFLREPTGDGVEKITPHKAMWPNFWGRMDKDGKVTPLAPTKVLPAAKDIVKELRATPWAPLSDEQVSKVLAALGSADGEPVYVSGGKLYRRNKDGKLSGEEHAAARPYAWPLAHDVRPVSQALGAKGCDDCHSSRSPIHYASVTAVGPVAADKALVKEMYELRGDGWLVSRLFAWSFTFRTMLKVICFACAAVLAGVLALYGLRALGAISSWLK